MMNHTDVSLGQYSYKPYGKLLSSSTPVSGNPFTCTAREDDATGLYYYRARYYDPTLELFISQDPLGDAQRYVAGNPISFVDPLGLYDVAFLHNPSLPGDVGHPAISFTQNGITHFYYKTIDQTGAPGIPYQGDLYEFNKRNWLPGGIDIYFLEDQSTFKNEHIFKVYSSPYGIPAIEGFSDHCSSYTANVLNYSIGKRNETLKQGEKPYPYVNGLTPQILLESLKRGGYIHPQRSFHLNN